eukprot:1016762-Amorphochlora_amoeboformis.AAC.1
MHIGLGSKVVDTRPYLRKTAIVTINPGPRTTRIVEALRFGRGQDQELRLRLRCFLERFFQRFFREALRLGLRLGLGLASDLGMYPLFRLLDVVRIEDYKARIIQYVLVRGPLTPPWLGLGFVLGLGLGFVVGLDKRAGIMLTAMKSLCRYTRVRPPTPRTAWHEVRVRVRCVWPDYFSNSSSDGKPILFIHLEMDAEARERIYSKVNDGHATSPHSVG